MGKGSNNGGVKEVWMLGQWRRWSVKAEKKEGRERKLLEREKERKKTKHGGRKYMKRRARVWLC